MTLTMPPDWTILYGLDLPILRARVTLRLLADAVLPAAKGAMLRGGFGYAFQHSSCPQPCWGASDRCAVASLCPYRWVFETPHPPGVAHLHDLQDVPRPFVIEPPLDGRTHYAAGDALEFGLILIGRRIDHLPYFLYGFEQLGQMGLGDARAPARLERVEALLPWQPIGPAIYRDGQVESDTAARLPVLDALAIAARAAALPVDLRLMLRTPLASRRAARSSRRSTCRRAAGGSTRWRPFTAAGPGRSTTARWWYRRGTLWRRCRRCAGSTGSAPPVEGRSRAR